MIYKDYFKHYSISIKNLLDDVDTNLIDRSVELINLSNQNNNKIYIVGNGGSASIASHVSVDFAKVAKIPSVTFNNANLITCFANDYGYENWVKESIKSYCTNSDLLILISSSGTSKNIVNAAEYCNQNKINLITLSGFKPDNPLSQLGKVNFHVKSDNYNYIEMTHHIILVSIVDIFTKKIF
jgi:D-sedoheptulose 7-phosphate isomerase